MSQSAPLALALALVLAAPPARADEPTYSPAFGACMSRSEGVTARMLDCIGDEHALQDRRLNTAYRGVQKALPLPRQPALKTAQRAWLAFRDAECMLLGPSDGGTAAHLVANDCMLRMTAERADALEAFRDALHELYGD